MNTSYESFRMNNRFTFGSLGHNDFGLFHNHDEYGYISFGRDLVFKSNYPIKKELQVYRPPHRMYNKLKEIFLDE